MYKKVSGLSFSSWVPIRSWKTFFQQAAQAFELSPVFYRWFRKHMSKAQILKDILIKGEDGGRLTRLPIHSATLQCIILLFKIYNQQLGEDATKCDDPSFASTCTIFLSMIHESMTLSIFLSPWETRVLDLIILAELELSSSFLLHCRC